MNRVYRISLLISILLSSVLSGCGAMQLAADRAVSPAGLQESLQGMKAAVTGMAGTFIYQHPTTGWVALAWPMKGSYGFVIIDDAGNAFKNLRDLCAAKCGWREAADFVSWMEKSGWLPLAAPAVPTAISSTIRQFSYLLSIGASLPAIPLIFVIPVTINPLEILNPGVDA